MLSSALVLAPLQAEPLAYIVNSDAFSDAGYLHRVDLADGTTTQLGQVGQFFTDIEGMAIGPDGQLYATDDATETLLVVNTANGLGRSVSNELLNLTLPYENGTSPHDYGITFSCDGSLYMASDILQELFDVNLETGEAVMTGTTGKQISGLAWWGEKLYGIGVNEDSGIYELDPITGLATLLVQIQGYTYQDAGLGFDQNGDLWAVLDGTYIPTFSFDPSTILKIDLDTGQVDFIAETLGGVESLAIAPPGGCEVLGDTALPIPALSSWSLYSLLLLFLAFGLLYSNSVRNRR